jgi:hypothetical protein
LYTGCLVSLNLVLPVRRFGGDDDAVMYEDESCSPAPPTGDCVPDEEWSLPQYAHSISPFEMDYLCCLTWFEFIESGRENIRRRFI